MRFGAGRHGRVGRRLGGVVVALAVAALVLLAPLGRLLPSAPALAAPANASAAGYLPTASQLPGAWREEATLDVGGLLEPDSHLRRVFVSADGGQTVVVEVPVRPSAVEAQTSLDARVNQLVLYHGWLFGAIAGLGDRAYRGIGVTADGLTDQTLVFRVKALAAEVGLISSVENPALVDAIARIVESRMLQDPNAVLAVPGFPATPQTLPGKEPPGPPVGGGAVGGGDAGVGNTAGGVGTTDTMLQITLLN